MQHISAAELVRGYFEVFRAKDRRRMEALFAEGFTFTSPYDDHIDTNAYFERCWPNCEKMREFRVIKLFEEGNEAFILYEAMFQGTEVFRNTEFFRTDGNRIKSVEVYFGSPARRA
jgi:ketosteroid isomerase-like protein